MFVAIQFEPNYKRGVWGKYELKDVVSIKAETDMESSLSKL